MVSGLERNPLNTGSRVSASLRGILQMPCAFKGPDPFTGEEAMSEKRIVTRILTVKLERLDSEMWRFLRDIASDQARYRNCMAVAQVAQARGFVVDPARDEKNQTLKKTRRESKGCLSGDAYVAAESEVDGALKRERKRIIAGYAPIPQWRWNNVLTIRGDADSKDSGVHVEQVGARFALALRVASKNDPRGNHVRLPIVAGKAIKQYQAGLLIRMMRWEVPIRKATLVFKPTRGEVEAKLSYRKEIELPAMGQRVATLHQFKGQFGPRLVLRTETEERDYTQKLATFRHRKDNWDAMRRRMTAQIGRCRGSARLKRKRIASIRFPEWTKTWLHQWSRELVDWCKSQGIGTIRLLNVGNGDWPAHQFESFVSYKAEELGMTVTGMEEADITEAATGRAATSEVKRRQRRAKKVREALRTLNAEYTEE